jgi:hypothetical protein
MAELFSIVRQCLYCWLHGFGMKTGAEIWLRRQGIRENSNYHLGSQRRPRE